MEYGIYSWWPKAIRPDDSMDEELDSMIHPDDLKLANELNPMGKVFIKSGSEAKYIHIEFGDFRLRVTPINWQPVDGDGFKVGDQVQVLSNGGANTEKCGIIYSMSWHHKNESIVYHLSVNGKRLKKQCYAIDIGRRESA